MQKDKFRYVVVPDELAGKAQAERRTWFFEFIAPKLEDTKEQLAEVEAALKTIKEEEEKKEKEQEKEGLTTRQEMLEAAKERAAAKTQFITAQQLKKWISKKDPKIFRELSQAERDKFFIRSKLEGKGYCLFDLCFAVDFKFSDFLPAAEPEEPQEKKPGPFLSFQRSSFLVSVFGEADFREAQFSGTAYFIGSQFSRKANFEMSRFSGEANFEEAQFSGAADFSGSQFSGAANFEEAQFSGEANFRLARFSGEVSFRWARFSGAAYFSGSKFSGAAYFSGSKFSGEARFSGSKLSGEADFIGAQFSGAADFSRSKFSGETDFQQAKFSRKAYFSEAQFREKTDFEKAQFSEEADFEKAQFSGRADFRWAKFSRKAYFEKAQFNGGADFSWAKFTWKADFEMARFRGVAYFSEAEFSTEANFSRAEFRDFIPEPQEGKPLAEPIPSLVTFKNASFKVIFCSDYEGSTVDFCSCVFEGNVYFDFKEFNYQASFNFDSVDLPSDKTLLFSKRAFPKRASCDGARLLKKYFDEQKDYLVADKFYQLEMEAQLANAPSFFMSALFLSVGKLTSDFAQNWALPLLWYFALTTLFHEVVTADFSWVNIAVSYGLILIGLAYPFWGKREWGGVYAVLLFISVLLLIPLISLLFTPLFSLGSSSVDYADFANPLHLTGIPEELEKPWEKNVYLFSRAVGIGLIYQLVVALKRKTRRR